MLNKREELERKVGVVHECSHIHPKKTTPAGVNEVFSPSGSPDSDGPGSVLSFAALCSFL